MAGLCSGPKLGGTFFGKVTNHSTKYNSFFWYPSSDAGGGSAGAIVLGKLPVPGRSTNLDYSRARAIVLAVGAGGGCLAIFLSSIISLHFLPLCGRRPDTD